MADSLVKPRWLVVALDDRDIAEVEGPKSNGKIMSWVRDLAVPWITQFFKDDAVPWCALFMDHCLQKAEVAFLKTLAAADYMKYGVPLAAPALGCILTFSRPGGNHVAFYLGEDAESYCVWGGNQSNKVGMTWIAKARCTSIR